MARRCRGRSAGRLQECLPGVYAQFEVHVAFSETPTTATGPSTPFAQCGAQGPALVQHEVEADAQALKVLGNPDSAVRAADFLVVPEGQPDGALRAVALGQVPFQRLQQRDHPDLVIETAAAPDDAVLHHAAERRMRPLAPRVFLDRHHVEVHEQHRLQRLSEPVNSYTGRSC
jgi:hypothetical protein